MTVEDMARTLRGWAHGTRMKVLTHQDMKFLATVAAKLEDQEERIALMTEPQEATQEQLVFPPADGEGGKV